jgi:hypothetical protein
MFLNERNKQDLLHRLPNVNLSYENIHKKVSSDFLYLIPKGRKYLVWFTYFQDKKVCLFIELNIGSNKSIKDIIIVPQMFEKKIVLGTIFFGTLFKTNKDEQFFSIENICYYKGVNIENKTEKEKIELLQFILKKEVSCVKIGKKGIGFGLPVVCKNFKEAIEKSRSLPYPIYSIQGRIFKNKGNTYNSVLYKDFNLEKIDKKIFAVKATLTNDIYHLFYKGTCGLEFFEKAYIPDFKTSVMMNNIFRKIKENKNLDALEESDDEEEFENIDEDKFVNLNKCVHMECIFNSRFNKYIPIKEVKLDVCDKFNHKR